MNKAYYYNNCTERFEKKEVQGQVVYLIDEFDAHKTTLSVSAVLLKRNEDFIAMDGGEYGQWQKPFVIDAPLAIDEDWEEEYNLIPTKPIKAGDKVYVYFGGDGDPYGTLVLGVFSRRLNADEISKLKEFAEEYTYADSVYEKMTTEILVTEE